ncbi:MAG: hypothetical protein CHACPFDD_00306 [Phycisphaerae bacterium]|nr:hypothetical protein [Phycisphaerae bacterium]
MRPMRTILVAVLVLAVLLPVGGCGPTVGAMAYYLGPRRIQKAEYKLTKGRLVILIEDLGTGDENPVFERALYEKLVEVFEAKKVNTQVAPAAELMALRQANAEFRSWSLQRIGRELDGEQVLYVRVDELRIKDAPDHPLVNPFARLRVKVVGVHEPESRARLWPEKDEWRDVEVERPVQEAGTSTQIDTVAAKLGRDAAVLVAQFFHDVDLEEKTPREP